MISCHWHSMILSLVEPDKNLTSLGYILVGNILSGNNMANFHTRGDSPRGGLISRCTEKSIKSTHQDRPRTISSKNMTSLTEQQEFTYLYTPKRY